MTIPINSMVLGKLGTNGDRQTFGIGTDGDPSPSLSTAHHHAVCYGINPQGGGMNPFDEELGETQSVCHQGGVMQVNAKAVRLDMNMGGDFLTDEAQTIRSCASATIKGGVIMSETIGFKAGQSADGGLGDEHEVSPTLSHKPSALEPTVAQSQCDLSQMRYIVRRLTPTEAERLMGLPSGYTIPAGLEVTDELVAEFQRIFDNYYEIMASYSKKPTLKHRSANQVRAWLEKITDPATCPDSPRYRVCGNGWATNQPRWILTRLLSAEGIEW